MEEVFETHSEEETLEVGRRIGARLEPPRTLLLYGPLGSGKTTLTKGLALGLEVQTTDDVTSPTFTLIHEYQGRCNIFHVDLYRVEGLRDLESIGLEDLFSEDAIVIIEWAEKLLFLPEHPLKIFLEDLGGDGRRIRCTDS
ncbi:MAG: tRNA (adenosine(37)-N6)-threonylcarbamoyltransferase complex ATPase subunit type 1 TsaE [Acidobacteria bacterium]|nr:tRNA (adenosine(37)-N6)-threonylcarbamoyltransferase complex ATPase subunit type 1 TsaE [Acidobacteriota bacterium]